MRYKGLLGLKPNELTHLGRMQMRHVNWSTPDETASKLKRKINQVLKLSQKRIDDKGIE